jgi:hypothetical protein
MIALGASAGFLLLTGSAMAGPCTAQIDVLQKQLQATDAGMGPTANGAVSGTGTINQSTLANPVSPSGQPQVPTTPATGTMNEASQNKATSAQDVQSQNTGEGTAADTATGATAATTTGDSSGQVSGNAGAAAAVQRAQQLDQAGDAAGCQKALDDAQNALQTQ